MEKEQILIGLVENTTSVEASLVLTFALTFDTDTLLLLKKIGTYSVLTTSFTTTVGSAVARGIESTLSGSMK